jgi:hypothetical protein
MARIAVTACELSLRPGGERLSRSAEAQRRADNLGRRSCELSAQSPSFPIAPHNQEASGAGGKTFSFSVRNPLKGLDSKK